MSPNRPPDSPKFSLAIRKAVMIALAVPILTVFAVMLLHYKGLLNVEEFGLPENYLYGGGFAMILVGVIPIFIIWRCPGCGSYLGRETSPKECQRCGARFR